MPVIRHSDTLVMSRNTPEKFFFLKDINFLSGVTLETSTLKVKIKMFNNQNQKTKIRKCLVVAP